MNNITNILDYTALDSLYKAIGVSGFENKICETFIDYIREDVDQCYLDSMGNAFALLKGDKNLQTIMIEAHADEIGFQVLHIEDSGFIYIRRNGGIDEQCIPGSQVLIQTQNGELIPGVIGKKPIHLMTADDRKRTIEINQLWVDTGLEAEEVKEKIAIGDPIAIAPNVMMLGDNKITGKSLDNKLGLFVVMQVMKRLVAHSLIKCSVVGVATVQEEIGARGAVVAGYSINPDIAITVDLDFATDVLDCTPSRYGKVALGHGVIIPRNADSNIVLSRQMEDIAKENGIPYQISARPHATGGTNTSRLQLTRNGIRTLSLGIPCRYMHTPVEICDLRDVDATVRLITKYCESL